MIQFRNHTCALTYRYVCDKSLLKPLDKLLIDIALKRLFLKKHQKRNLGRNENMHTVTYEIQNDIEGNAKGMAAIKANNIDQIIFFKVYISVNA